MDFDSVGLYQRGEHLDPVVGYSDSSAISHNGQVTNATGKGMSTILTKISNNDQQLQNIPGINKAVRHFHRG